MFDKLVDVIVQFIHLFQFWFVVQTYEESLVLRFGKLHRMSGPGAHWKLPFNMENVLRANVVPETMTVGPQSLTTKDDQGVVISTVVTFRIEDVKKFLLEIEGAHQVMEDATYGIVSRYVMRKTWGEMLGDDIDHEITKKVRSQARKYGVEVLAVQIVDFTKSRSLRLIQPLNHHSHL